MTPADIAEPCSPLRAAVYSPPWRVAATMLRVISGASLLALLALLLVPGSRPLNPLFLLRLATGLCLLPGLAALLIRRAFAAFLRVEGGALILEQHHGRTEIPVAAIARLTPWLLPRPGSGLWLDLRSGRRWRGAIEMDDPSALVDMLATAGGTPSPLATARHHPAMIYARARSHRFPRPWYAALIKFPLFALVPTLPLFRVHQIIAYGGPLGEYYQYGLGPYLAGFGIYWATLTVYLVLYAAVLRTFVETISLGAALIAPPGAVRVRRLLERVSAVFYYGGVPVAVALRLAPW